MKIAIVSDDHQTISAHFGRAQFYEVFTINAGKGLLTRPLSDPTHKLSPLAVGMNQRENTITIMTTMP